LGHGGSLAEARGEGYREGLGSARTTDRGYVREFAIGSFLSFAVLRLFKALWAGKFPPCFFAAEAAVAFRCGAQAPISVLHRAISRH
jgi:hypothetical protein